jgi:hypothetical protein
MEREIRDDILNKIACRLLAEGVTAGNYDRDSAEKALSGCVSAHTLIPILQTYEIDIIELLQI